MSELLFFPPIYKKLIWGGDKLKNKLHFDCPEGTGECWAISAHEHGMSVVSSGTYRGKTLEELWTDHPELFGNEDGRFGSKYPLLVKWIDAKEDLSIQVHPDDSYARLQSAHALGKMECWYVLDCEKNAHIIIGHNAHDKMELKKMIEDQQWEKLLREYPIQAGSFFQIQPGYIHAIKGGTTILETQQSSDITYRVYDYDRLQDGKPRPLHIKESLDVIQAPFHKEDEKRQVLMSEQVDLEHLVTCSKYSVEKYTIHGSWQHRFRAPFTNLTVIAGSGYIDNIPVELGQSMIVPNKYGTVVLSGEFTVICSWAECGINHENPEHKNIQEYYSIEVLDWMGRKKAEVYDEEQGILAFKDIYEAGDCIKFHLPKKNEYYMIRVDDTMDENFVFSTTDEITYEIPFGEKRKSLNQKAFSGDRHYMTVRAAREYEISAYKNLAKNVMDQHGEHGCYPHASANVETRGESVFSARNAIDGVVANDSHGSWPYESWGINKNDKAEMLLEFGRQVNFDRIVLYTRADFPHDSWWKSITLSFSDHTEETVELNKSRRPHVLEIQRKNITWIKLSKLKKANDPSPFPALTQIEVYGTESE